ISLDVDGGSLLITSNNPVRCPTEIIRHRAPWFRISSTVRANASAFVESKPEPFSSIIVVLLSDALNEQHKLTSMFYRGHLVVYLIAILSARVVYQWTPNVLHQRLARKAARSGAARQSAACNGWARARSLDCLFQEVLH